MSFKSYPAPDNGWIIMGDVPSPSIDGNVYLQTMSTTDIKTGEFRFVDYGPLAQVFDDYDDAEDMYHLIVDYLEGLGDEHILYGLSIYLMELNMLRL